MTELDKKAHWENIYQNKAMQEVSWYQEMPATSLNLISKTVLPLEAAIIDVGGGDGFLIDELLRLNYTNLTVLDISNTALNKAKLRLGSAANHVQWICENITEFEPEKPYDLWHDRAAFHFLTEDAAIEKYLSIVQKHVKVGGHLILGTFSKSGPLKCSGIEIKQYDIADLQELLQPCFEVIEGFNENHPTPFDTIQNFTFALFKRKQ